MIFPCSQDTQKLIREAIKEHGLNRWSLPRAPLEPVGRFSRKHSKRAGLNRLVRMANVRDQDSSVHRSEPEKADTEGEKTWCPHGCCKATLLEPLWSA